MAHIPVISTDYLAPLLTADSLQDTANACSAFLAQANLDFQAIAFRGMSGALIAPLLAVLTGKSLIMVRKEPSHSGMLVEGDRAASRYIIVDDFVETGATVTEIITEVHNFAPDAKCIGVLEVNYPHTYVNGGCLTDPRRFIPPYLRSLVDHPGVYPCV